MRNNNPNAPHIYLPNLSAKAQKFGIPMKKGLHRASVVRVFFQCYFRPQRVEAQGLKSYFLALFVGSRIFEPDRKCVVEIVDNIMIRFHESRFEELYFP